MFLDLISDCLVRLSASPSTFVMFFFFSSINGSDDGGIVGERATKRDEHWNWKREGEEVEWWRERATRRTMRK